MTTADIQFRPFVLADYEAVIALWRRFPGAIGVGRSDTRGEIAKKLARDPDLFLVAEQDGAILGSVIGGFDGRRGLVYHLAVAPERQRAGIGRRLMAEVENRLRAKGCVRAYLLVLADNRPAIDYYRTLGWEAMEITCMAKNLD